MAKKEDTADSIETSLEEKANKVKNLLSKDNMEYLEEQAKTYYSELMEYIKDNPLKSVMIAGSIGAIVNTLMTKSKRPH